MTTIVNSTDSVSEKQGKRVYRKILVKVFLGSKVVLVCDVEDPETSRGKSEKESGTNV